MHVASLGHSRELYDLSGFSAGYMEWYYDKYVRRVAPKYDLGYLLRNLPEVVATDELSYFTADLYLKPHIAETWNAGYRVGASFPKYSTVADTPEDAAAKLCIELFKQGILTPERK
jgi:hypothetical protein